MLLITLNMYLFTAILMAERINPNSINMFKGNRILHKESKIGFN